MEDMKTIQDYAITINVEDSKQLQYYIRRIFYYASGETYYERSSTGRPHAHGVIRFHSYDDIYKLYKYMNDNYLNIQVEIDTIDDMQKWKAYMTKQHMYKACFAKDIGSWYNKYTYNKDLHVLDYLKKKYSICDN